MPIIIKAAATDGRCTMKKITLLLACLLALAPLPAGAVTKIFSWTWTNAYNDGTALPLTSIGGIQICDMSVPVPAGSCNGGTPVPCPTAIPPTTATGTCTANVISGHSFVAIELDNTVPPRASPPSNSVTVPLSVPNPITDLKVQ